MARDDGDERDVRTSKTNPIRIDWLGADPPGSLVGLTFAPGKRCRSTDGFWWERDVDLDLAVLVAERATALVCLLEDHELAPNGLVELLPRARALGLDVLRLPIRDYSVPDDVARVDELLDAVDDRVARGARVVIHCLGGLGRTGTIAGCHLVRRGMTTDDALTVLRRVRGDRCPENEAQCRFVATYEAHVRRRVLATQGTRDGASRSAAAPPRASRCWYATDPRQLADGRALEETARALANTGRHGRRSLVARIEADVERDPGAFFSFDAGGAARLQTSERVFHAGRFSTPTIGELGETIARRARKATGRVRLSILHGAHVLTDIGTLQASAPEGVLFQVASQFNCLEAPGSRIVRVRDYLHDSTQGPRASISALPGTLLRHYRAPGAGAAAGGERFVQRDDRCLNLLADAFDASVAVVRSGYLEVSAIRDREALAAALTDRFERIRVGFHDDVEIVFGHDWDGPVPSSPQRVAQVFTSTLALGGYGRDDGSRALRTVRQELLRAAYLGTLLSAIASNKHTVVLTLIGGGAFGNPRDEIWEAIRWSLAEVEGLVDEDMHVVVNTREELTDREHAEVRARGGFVADFAVGSVRVSA